MIIINEQENSTHLPAPHKRTRWTFAVAIILAVFFLYITIRKVNWTAFIQVISDGQYGFLPLFLLAGSINYFIRSQRWGILLTAETKIPSLRIFWATMIGYAGNAYLPARAGELLRSITLAKRSEISISYVLATALTERLIDVVTLVIVSTVSLFFIQSTPSVLRKASQLMAIISIAGLVFLFITPALDDRIENIINILPFRGNWKAKLRINIRQFLKGLIVLRKKQRYIYFIILTILIWFVDGLIAMGIAFMIQQELTLSQALLLLSGLGLASAIPSTPGYIGIYQFIAITVLPMFRYTPSEALAYIVVAQAMNYLIVSFWGILGVWRINHNEKDDGVNK